MASENKPIRYTPELGDEICDRLTSGESLVRICKDKNMPAPKTVYSWLRTHSDFGNNYTRARENQADTYADEITYIADTEDDPNKAKVRIDARKWTASKLRPKKYGDKIDMTTDGKALPTPIYGGFSQKGADEV